MILTTHAIVGAAAASLFPQKPGLAFSVAFLSHFLLDAIPHWEYSIRSNFANPKISGKLEFNKALLLDAITIGSDLVIGFGSAWLFFSGAVSFKIILLGALAGILPDPLQIVFSRLRFEPFKTVQRFHERIQRGSPIHKNNPAAGIIWQILFIGLVILITKVAIL